MNCATALHRLARLGCTTAAEEVVAVMSRAVCVLAEHPVPNGRTLTSLAHAVGVLGGSSPATAAAVLEGITVAAIGLPPDSRDAPGALATLVWACGTLELVPPSINLVWTLLAAAAERMSGAELANAAWGCARANLRPAEALAALARSLAVRAGAGELTEQGISNAAWAWAKLRLPAPRLFAALGDAAIARLARAGGGRDSQALATLAWAFSRWPDARVNAAICNAVKNMVPSLPQATVASLLQSLSGGSAETVTAEALDSEPSCAPGVDAAVLTALAARSVAFLPRCSASELGLIAAAIAREKAHIDSKDAQQVADVLAKRCRAVAPEMEWRGVAAAELALRTLDSLAASAATEENCSRVPGFEGGDPRGGRHAKAAAALARRAIESSDALASASDSVAATAPSLLIAVLRGAVRIGLDTSLPAWLRLETVPLTSGAVKQRKRRVLLIGDDPCGYVTSAVAESGMKVTHWRRFASDGAAARAPTAAPWPRTPDDVDVGAEVIEEAASRRRQHDAVLLRYPQSTDALSFAVAAAALLMPRAGASLLLYGRHEEGVAGSSAMAALRPYFTAPRMLAESPGGAVLFIAERTAAAATRVTADAWRETLSISFPRARDVAIGSSDVRPWVVYPGLFARGTLDIMTAELLASMPSLPRRSRVLDFACGSGSIAAALLAREPTLRCTLLDADAVALEAATKNVPTARRVILSSMWPAPPRLAPGRRKLNFIVSNPPVHRYEADDMRVIRALVEGAPARTRPRGELWIVAQAQVPVGRLLAAVSLDGAVKEAPAASLAVGGAENAADLAATEAGVSAACAYTKIHALPVSGGRFVVWRAIVA